MLYQSKLVALIEGEPPRLENVEVLMEEEHARDIVDKLQLIRKIRTICFDEMENGTTHDNLYGTLQ